MIPDVQLKDRGFAYTYMYIYTYIYVNIYVYIPIYTYIYQTTIPEVQLRDHSFGAYTCEYAHTHIHTYIHIYILQSRDRNFSCTPVTECKCKVAHKYICIHTYIHIHIYINKTTIPEVQLRNRDFARTAGTETKVGRVALCCCKRNGCAV